MRLKCAVVLCLSMAGLGGRHGQAVEIARDGAGIARIVVADGSSPVVAHAAEELKRFIKEVSGAEAATTNNRMELTAVIEALAALKRRCRVRLYSDSKYVLQGITEWLPAWKARGWKTASRAKVKNQDLWERLDEAVLAQDIEWIWVKGHAGTPGNERADELANLAIDQMQARR